MQNNKSCLVRFLLKLLMRLLRSTEVIKIFGHCKIRGLYLEHTDKSQLVLVVTTNNMSKANIPELVSGDVVESWVINVNETLNCHASHDKGAFQSKLLSLITNEWKTLADITLA